MTRIWAKRRVIFDLFVLKRRNVATLVEYGDYEAIKPRI
jgi:hypothetical protein